MNRKALFIGGPIDGQRRMVERPYVTQTVVEAPPVPVADWGSGEAAMSYTHHVYRGREFKSSDGYWIIYGLDSMSDEDVMGALIEGYKGAKGIS